MGALTIDLPAGKTFADLLQPPRRLVWMGLPWLCGVCAGPENTAAIILDVNSQIRFHESMMTKATAKIPCIPLCIHLGIIHS